MVSGISEYGGATVFDSEGVLLGQAKVDGRVGAQEISLYVDDATVDGITLTFMVTLENDAFGLVTYRASLNSFGRSREYLEYPYKVNAELLEMVGVAQRRDEFKVKTSISTTFRKFDDENEGKYCAEIRDLSASGAFFVSKEELECNDVVEFDFDALENPFTVQAEIVRVNPIEDGTIGYGARFVNLPEGHRAKIRMYVYNVQLAKRVKGMR